MRAFLKLILLHNITLFLFYPPCFPFYRAIPEQITLRTKHKYYLFTLDELDLRGFLESTILPINVLHWFHHWMFSFWLDVGHFWSLSNPFGNKQYPCCWWNFSSIMQQFLLLYIYSIYHGHDFPYIFQCGTTTW